MNRTKVGVRAGCRGRGKGKADSSGRAGERRRLCCKLGALADKVRSPLIVDAEPVGSAVRRE